jgi:hypothetical protein
LGCISEKAQDEVFLSKTIQKDYTRDRSIDREAYSEILEPGAGQWGFEKTA